MLRLTRAMVLGLVLPALLVASAVHAQCVRWEVQPWMGIPGMDGKVNDLEVWDPDGAGGEEELLVIGGGFTAGATTSCRNLAVWDGQELRELARGTADEVWVVKLLGGELWLVTRDFSAYPLTRARVWRLQGEALVPLGGELTHVDDVHSPPAFVGLMECDGLPTLITNFATMDGVTIPRALQWTGEWQPMPRPLPAVPRTIRSDAAGRTFVNGGSGGAPLEWVEGEWRGLAPCRDVPASNTACVVPFGTGAVEVWDFWPICFQGRFGWCGSLARPAAPAGLVLDDAWGASPEVLTTSVTRSSFEGCSVSNAPVLLTLNAAGSRSLGTLNSGGEVLDFVRWRGRGVIAGRFGSVGETEAANIAFVHEAGIEPLAHCLGGRVTRLARSEMGLYAVKTVTAGNYNGADYFGMQILRLSGTTWTPVGAPQLNWPGFTDGGVSGIYRVDGADVMLGSYLANPVVRWSGTAWVPMSIVAGSYPYQVVRVGDEFYLELDGEVRRWDGSNWGVVFSGQRLRSLVEYEGALHAIVTTGTQGAWVHTWSRWDAGRWQGLFRMEPNPRYPQLASVSPILAAGRLLASGYFADTTGVVRLAVAEWGEGAWRVITPPWLGPSTFPACQWWNGAIYGSVGAGVYRAERDEWRQVASVDGGTVAGLLADGDRLYARGTFTRVGERAVSGVGVLRVSGCPADIDCSGGVDSDDTIEFFFAWDTNDSRADVNGDGGVDADDTIAFFERWEGGC